MAVHDSKPLVLVTGATGYIAGHCIRELIQPRKLLALVRPLNQLPENFGGLRLLRQHLNACIRQPPGLARRVVLPPGVFALSPFIKRR